MERKGILWILDRFLKDILAMKEKEELVKDSERID